MPEAAILGEGGSGFIWVCPRVYYCPVGFIAAHGPWVQHLAQGAELLPVFSITLIRCTRICLKGLGIQLVVSRTTAC